MQIELETYQLQADDGIPNNQLPLIVYRNALSGGTRSADGCASLFQQNGWQGNWVNGFYPYWHYHPLAH